MRVGPGMQPPVAAFTFMPPSPEVNEWVRFDGAASSDPDGTIVSHSWSFGDGNTATGARVWHRFTAPGIYIVTLTVTDNDGLTATKVANVRVRPVLHPPVLQPPVAAFTFSPAFPLVGAPITLNATASFDPDGTIVSYRWDLDGDGIDDASGQITTFRYYSVGPHPVRLTVVDNDGLSATTTQVINVGGIGIPPIIGEPPMGGIPGIFVWGTDTWNVTVNAGAGWTSARRYRLELRTDGSFQNVNRAVAGVPGVVPLGIVPTPIDAGRTLVFEGDLLSGRINHTFTVPDSESVWMRLQLDIDGDGDLDESTGFVYLRSWMVRPPTVPFVVGLHRDAIGPLVPGMNFRIGSAFVYTATTRFVMWMTDIATLERR